MRTRGTIILHSGKGVVFDTETTPGQLDTLISLPDPQDSLFVRIDGINDVGADVVIIVARSDIAALVLEPPRQVIP